LGDLCICVTKKKKKNCSDFSKLTLTLSLACSVVISIKLLQTAEDVFLSHRREKAEREEV
jgi:hypothetical protein